MKGKWKPPHIAHCLREEHNACGTAKAIPAGGLVLEESQASAPLLPMPLEIQGKQGQRERQSSEHMLLR